MTPEFLTEGEFTVSLRFPRFVLARVTGPGDSSLVEPLAGCSFADGREYGIVEWIDVPEPRHVNDATFLARLARRAAEHGRLS